MVLSGYEYRPLGRSTEQRFWEKVDQSGGPDDCWIWLASKNVKGYGQFSFGPKQKMGAHRTSFILTHGEIPDGMAVHHVCQNPPCVNPNHLRLVTVNENSTLRWSLPSVPKVRYAKPKAKSVQNRFWEKVDRSGGLFACWTWKGYVNSAGYAVFWWGTHRNPEPVHRVAWQLTVGDIPEGMYLDHLCRNRSCVNPSHLEPVTPSQNQHRRLDHHPCVFKCGHEAMQDNVRVQGGTWVCRQCNNRYVRDRNARRKGYTPVSPSERTHCPQGHIYDDENTGFAYKNTARQYRYCRKCRENYRHEQSLAKGRRPPSGKRTHCPQGHTYDVQNTYLTLSGRRQCRTCKRKNKAKRRAEGRKPSESKNSCEDGLLIPNPPKG